MAPSENGSIGQQPSWLFRICGSHQTCEIPEPATGSSQDDAIIVIDDDDDDENDSPALQEVRANLISCLGIEKEACITFHLEQEACSTQRSLYELLSIYPPARVGESTLQIHLQRAPAPTGSFKNESFQANIAFSAHEESDAAIDTEMIWKDVRVTMPVYAMSIEDFHNAIKDIVVQRLEEDRALRHQLEQIFGRGTRDHGKGSSWYLRFEAVVHSRTNHKIFIRLAEDHPYIKRISRFHDLFRDPETLVGRDLHITIGILFGRRDVGQDLVQAYMALDSSPPPPNFIPLGRILKDQRRADEPITVRHVLLGKLDEAGNLEGLYHLPAWNLDGGQLISQLPLTNAIQVPFDRNYKWSPRFQNQNQNFRTIRDLEWAIIPQTPPPSPQDQARDRNPNLPFEPPMSLNHRSPSTNPTPLPPDTAIPIVVRIQPHHPTLLNPPDALPILQQNLTCQILLSGTHTARDLTEKMKNLMIRNMDVFPEEGRWKGEIWILPQREEGEGEGGVPSLVRFTEGIGVREFMVRERVQRGEVRMYMEFHMWVANGGEEEEEEEGGWERLEGL